MCIEFLKFSKKIWPSLLMYCWTYRLGKTWLDKCLKSPVLEDPLTSNMVNGRKHRWNLNDSTFTIFIAPCRLKTFLWVICKILWLFLKPLPPMTDNLFLIDTINSNRFSGNYLKQKVFLNFFFHFWNLDWIWNIFQKEWPP